MKPFADVPAEDRKAGCERVKARAGTVYLDSLCDSQRLRTSGPPGLTLMPGDAHPLDSQPLFGLKLKLDLTELCRVLLLSSQLLD